MTPLVINSLGGGHTHMHALKHAYRHSRTVSILRNQACGGVPGLKGLIREINISLKTG